MRRMTVRGYDLVLFIALLVAVAVAAPAALAQDGPPGKPDIVVIMVDDLGFTDNRILERLPNIKALFLDGGLSFTQYFGETPLCCPGRAEFLTGQHVRRNHVVRNDARLLDPTNTLATTLRDDGYETALVGKYFNHSDLLTDKMPPGWDHLAMYTSDTDIPSTFYIDGNGPITEGYLDRFVVDDSVNWVSGLDPDKPFFLLDTPRAPHFKAGDALTAWLPAVEDRYVDDPRCAGIAPWAPPSYAYLTQPLGWPLDDICRSMLTVDDLVGQLQEEMHTLHRDPIYVFTSDNGMAWGQHGFPVKNNPYATQMPLYFTGAGIRPAATNALESNIDLGPTLAELAGTTMPYADGQSFARVLYDPNAAGRTWMLEDEPTAQFTNGPWRKKWWGIREPGWYLLQVGTNRPLVFNLVKDPWRLHPVRKPLIKQELKALYPY